MVASLAILVPAASVYWRLTHPWPIPPTVVPDPNGYDELIRAGKLLSAVTAPDFDNVMHAQLKAYVAQCSGVYAPIRAALRKPCEVPSRRWGDKNLKQQSADMQTLHAVSRALYGQGRLAATEGRTAEAIAAYLDAIRLSQAVQRGGRMVDLFVGLVCEAMGNRGLAEMRKSLSVKECKTLLSALRGLPDEPAPLEECWARDAAWYDRVYGWQGRFVATVEEVIGAGFLPTDRSIRL